MRERLKAQLAYERALQDGYVMVYRGRILLIGQDRAGKTSLKKSLLGLPFDSGEQSTEGIEVDPSKCEIGVDQAAKDSAHISPADFEKGSLGSYKHGKKKVISEF